MISLFSLVISHKNLFPLYFTLDGRKDRITYVGSGHSLLTRWETGMLLKLRKSALTIIGRSRSKELLDWSKVSDRSDWQVLGHAPSNHNRNRREGGEKGGKFKRWAMNRTDNWGNRVCVFEFVNVVDLWLYCAPADKISTFRMVWISWYLWIYSSRWPHSPVPAGVSQAHFPQVV